MEECSTPQAVCGSIIVHSRREQRMLPDFVVQNIRMLSELDAFRPLAAVEKNTQRRPGREPHPTFRDSSKKLPTLCASNSTITTCGLISLMVFSTSCSKTSGTDR